MRVWPWLLCVACGGDADLGTPTPSPNWPLENLLDAPPPSIPPTPAVTAPPQLDVGDDAPPLDARPVEPETPPSADAPASPTE